MIRSEKSSGMNLSFKRIDLVEWQDIGELPEFKDNPFLPIKTISQDVKQYIDISDISPNGIRIKAKNYVGILPLSEGYIVTVSPKAPVEDFLYILYRAQGRKVSIREFEEITSIGEKPAKEYPNIFHFLTSVLLVELEKIRTFGFLKKSRFCTQSRMLKGKVLVKETAKYWMAGDKSKIVCGNFELSKDNPENRAIKFTLQMLLTLYFKSLGETRDDFFEKYRWFEDIPLERGIEFINDVEEAISYKTIPNSRSYYYDILNLCMFFVTHSTLDYTSAKQVRVRSFVVDMNKVFEEYLCNVLKDGLTEPYSLKRYSKAPLFDNTEKYYVEPDYLLLEDGKITAIADAKYKPEPTTDDFYQVLVYADRYNVTNALLIYPSWSGTTYTESYRFKERQVKIIHFDMSNVEESEKMLIETVVGFGETKT